MNRDLSCRYRVVDVFTRQALEGNPLAVFPDAAHLDAMTMQRIARELNLPETTFVLPVTRDDCVARVRIFTPAREMAFAGHPTLGTSFVLWEEGRLSGAGHAFNLEEQVGPVPVRIGRESPPLLWLGMPPVHDGPRFSRAACARALELGLQDLLEFEPQLLSAGNPTIVVPLRNRDAVDRARLDESGVRALRDAGSEPCCVYVFARTAEGVYSRMFAPEYGIVEDPATGSATGPLAVYMMRHGLLPADAATTFVCEQGVKMGRRSLLHVEVRGARGSEDIFVGGHVTSVASATMHFVLEDSAA
jgi:trans-2,3-dihydro-3-hydroxyanthranilate isomerase